MLFHQDLRGVSPAHLSPVVLKHHEAGLRVSSAGAGGGGTPARPTPWTPRVQPAQPAHTGSGEGRSKVTSTQRWKEGVPVKRLEYRRDRRQRWIRERRDGKDDVERRRRRRGGEEGEKGWGGKCIRTERRRGRRSAANALSLPVSVRLGEACCCVRVCVTLSSL